MIPYDGMNLRDARRLWPLVGGDVRDKQGTGEEVYRHPTLHRSITVNKRRKSAPRELTKALRRLWP